MAKQVMTDYRACEIAEGFGEFERREATREELREAWQHLVDTGLCWKLQGWYGRCAMTLIVAGEIKPPKEEVQDMYGNVICFPAPSAEHSNHGLI